MTPTPDTISPERVYQAQAPCDQVLAALRQVVSASADQERRRARAFVVGTGASIAGAFTLILAFAVAGVSEGRAPWLLWVPLALGLVGGGAFFVRSRLERLELEERHLELASQVVRLLQADIAPREPVTITLDLRPSEIEAKAEGSGQNSRRGRVRHYLDPWLTLQGRLLDGTHFQLDVTERIEQRKVQNSGPGGSKLKLKRKATSTVRVRLRVNPERYAHLARLRASARGAIRLPQGAQLKELQVARDRMDLSVLVNVPWVTRGEDALSVNGPQVVALSFLSLYQILNLSRALDTKASSAA